MNQNLLFKHKSSEKYFFLLLLILHLLPVLLVRFFPSTDGPAHLFNATLIKQLLFQPNRVAHLFFEFNPHQQPNWSGHLVLLLFQCLFPAWLSEKLLLIIYIVGLAFSYRALVLRVNPNAGISTCLIFPFIYTFIFYLGFYNFLLSLPLLFFICEYYIRHQNNLSRSNLIILAVLFLLIYFSHPLSFGLAVICVFALLLFGGIKKGAFKQFVFLACSLIPCFLLTVNYITNSTVSGFKGTVDYLPTSELLSFLTSARPLICYTQEEQDLTKIVFYVFVCLTSLFIITRFIHLFRTKNVERKLFYRSDVWLLLSVFSTFLLFTVPDNVASGGFVSIRLCLFVFLFLAVWLSVTDSIWWLKNIGVMVVVLVGIKLSYNRFEATQALCDEVKIVEHASSLVKENTIVLPLNYSTRWTTINTLSYVGCIKSVTLLDNYEASYKAFPLLWKPLVDPSVYLGDQGKTSHPCIAVLKYEKHMHHKIDYVITFQRSEELSDSCTMSTLAQLNALYNKIYTDSTRLVEVYERK